MDIIIYAIIAAVLAYRLYTLLGQRHEGERQRQNPFDLLKPQPPKKDAKPDKEEGDKDDVLAFPLSVDKPQDAYNPLSAAQALPAPESMAGGLYAIRRADPNFDEKQFLRGARMAFEMIVHAFAAGEREALKNLMSPRLYAPFEKAIDAREAAGDKMEMKMLHVRDADIVQVRMEGDDAFISVQYVSDQRKAVTAGDGALKDAGTVDQLTDVWTYRRSTRSADPNWLLVETRSV